MHLSTAVGLYGLRSPIIEEYVPHSFSRYYASYTDDVTDAKFTAHGMFADLRYTVSLLTTDIEQGLHFSCSNQWSSETVDGISLCDLVSSIPCTHLRPELITGHLSDGVTFTDRRLVIGYSIYAGLQFRLIAAAPDPIGDLCKEIRKMLPLTNRVPVTRPPSDYYVRTS